MSANLPTLTGSEKQVKWANGIRAKLVSDLEREIAAWESLAKQHEQDSLPEFGKMVEGFAGRMAKVKAVTSAAWWIDCRDKSARSILQSWVKGMGV